MKKNSYFTENVYPLEWLDETIALLSRPPEGDGDGFISGITERLDSEFGQLKKLLNGIAFSPLKKKKIKRLLRHYHLTLTLFRHHTLLYSMDKENHTVALHEHICGLLSFMEVRFAVYLKKNRTDKDVTDKSKRPDPFKLLCILSQDQLGIILKAADDLRIIISRSLSNVFNQLTPYLSTPHKENLSADSMRSHTYSIEERDKEIAIDTLQKMIEKIKEY